MPPGHSYRGPRRPPRFMSGPAGASLRASLNASAAQRTAQSAALRQTAQELNAFMDALAEVERAGSRLHTLPPERLLEIQRVLRAGVSGPNGTVMLDPVQPAADSSDINAIVSSLSNRHSRAAGASPSTLDAPAVNGLDGNDNAPTSGGGLTEEQITAHITKFVVGASGAVEASGGSAAVSEADRDVCAICLSEMSDGEECTALHCCHVFHSACCVRWLRLAPSCPLCKSDALGRPTNKLPATAEGTGDAQQQGEREAEMEREAAILMQGAASAIGASRAASIDAIVGHPHVRGLVGIASRPDNRSTTATPPPRVVPQPPPPSRPLPPPAAMEVVTTPARQLAPMARVVEVPSAPLTSSALRPVRREAIEARRDQLQWRPTAGQSQMQANLQVHRHRTHAAASLRPSGAPLRVQSVRMRPPVRALRYNPAER